MAGGRISSSISASGVVVVTIFALLALLCQITAAARDLKQDGLPDVPFPTRVFWDPNRGDVDRVNDYIGVNPQIGIVDIAEADPTIAAAGVGATAGIRTNYDTAGQFDYESPTSRLEFGPGARATAAAVARVLGLGAFKGLGTAGVTSRSGHNRNAWNSNTARLGTVNTVGGSASAGLYLDRTGASDSANEQPSPSVGIFGLFGR